MHLMSGQEIVNQLWLIVSYNRENGGSKHKL
jgi:hypothetical protein